MAAAQSGDVVGGPASYAKRWPAGPFLDHDGEAVQRAAREAANLAEDLRMARLKARLSQRALAELAGVTKDVVGDIELGKRWGSGLTIAKLAAALALRLGMFEPEARRFGPPDAE